MPKTSRTRRDNALKRPYLTQYYNDAGTRDNAWSSQGFSASDRGAVRASVVRIFMGEYGKALIYDRRDGTLAYTVKVGANGLQIHYGNATGEVHHIRRVK